MSRRVRLMVTGSSGFIGSRLVLRALALGHHVVGVDRLPTTGLVRAAAQAGPGALVALQGDVTDLLTAQALHDHAAAADAVVHCAARAGVRSARGTDAVTLEAERARDILGSARAVLAAVPPATPLVVLSSSAVYGGCLDAWGRMRPSRESDPVRPVGPYAAWKVAVEQACAGRAADGGHVTVVRPFTVVGEGQRPDMAVAAWLAAARTGAPLQVLGGLDRSRDLTDVEHVVSGVLTVLDRGVRGTLNLGSGRPRTLQEVLDAVRRAVVGTGCATGELRVDVRPAPAEEVPASWACTDRLASLGLDTTTDLDDVVRRQLVHQLAGTRPPVAA